MVKLILSVGLLIVASTYVKASCQYGGFLTCLNDTILKEWSDLDADSKGKLDRDRAKSIKCLRTVSCSDKCEPADDFSDELKDDPTIQKLVIDIKNVWDKWPRTMQACFLEKVRDNFFGELEKKVQKKVPDFSLPKDLGALPMPPQSMYKNNRESLRRYVSDRIGALLCLQSCSYEDKKKVVRCMKKEIDVPLGKCVSDKICSVGDCKKSFKGTCDAVSQSIQDIVKDGDAKLSSFDDGSQSNALRDLKRCKERALSEESGLVEGDFYKASDYVKIFQAFTHVKAEKKTDKFKQLLKDLFNSYFDGDAFCSSQDC